MAAAAFGQNIWAIARGLIIIGNGYALKGSSVFFQVHKAGALWNRKGRSRLCCLDVRCHYLGPLLLLLFQGAGLFACPPYLKDRHQHIVFQYVLSIFLLIFNMYYLAPQKTKSNQALISFQKLWKIPLTVAGKALERHVLSARLVNLKVEAPADDQWFA